MNTPNTPGELKTMWNESSAIELAMFFGLIVLVLSVSNALGIWAAQKIS